MNRLKARFRAWTIRTKLTLIMMVSSTVAVGVGCAIFVAFTMFAVWQEHARDLHDLADVIGHNSQAALRFDLPEDAARNLGTLEKDDSIVFACIFDLQGKVLAIYRQEGQPESLVPPVLEPEGHEFEDSFLKVFEDVEMDGEVIARIYIQDDLREEKAQLGRSIATMILVMAVSLLAAYLISWRLQKLISRPILSLAATAADIGARKDYSVRAEKESEDEIGTLIDSFNDMLTQIQRGEEVIHTSEEHFRDFFQNAPIGFHIFGPDRLIIDINEAELAMTGYERDEIVNKKTWADLIVDEQQEMFEQHWKDITTRGEARNIEYTMVHKDGHHVDVILNASVRFDEEGNLINTRGSVLDISERKRMMTQVRQSQQMLKTVLDTIAVRVFWKGVDLNFLGCNQLFADDGGVENPEEIVGKSDFDMAWKAQAEAYRRDDRQVMESGESKLNYEESQTTLEGKNIWLSTSKIPLRDDNGDIIGVLGTYEDITKRKRADLALRLSEQRFRAIADYTYNWEIWISPTGGVLWTNPAVERITGYSVAECMAMTDYPGSLVVEEDRAMVVAAREKGLKEEPGQIECRIRRKDGKVIWVVSSWQPIYDDKGVWQGQRVSVRDITDRKRLLQILEAKNRELESIVYTSSHDLRSTIVNVQGFSSELSVTCEHLLDLFDDIPLPHEKLRAELATILQEEIPTELKYISTSANKMDMLIKGLLKLSRLGQVEMKMEHIDMNALMTEVIDSIQYQIQQAGADVRVDRLPDCTADAAQMTQIFWNLIDNAIKYRDTERQCTIEISGSVKEDMSVYCVADNGCGILPRHQKNIFEVFHRLDPEGAVGGEGLGLSIIRRIIDRHGGEVRIESAAGQGSRFFVSVPTNRKISIG
ncbi:MAG: PAS domain S-box protein [Planctomycetes bacterium]|nr:PAS domain S-box protein [Planctomycetota bacterium]